MASAQALDDERMDPPAGNDLPQQQPWLERSYKDWEGRDKSLLAPTVGVVHATQQF